MKATLAILVVAAIAGCSTITSHSTSATETALCDVWQDSLPSRSRDDTRQTQEEIGRAYDKFEAACQRKVKI